MVAEADYLFEVGAVFVDQLYNNWGDNHRAFLRQDGRKLTIRFYNRSTKQFDSAMGVSLYKDSSNLYDLCLDNVYIPDGLRNKGFLTCCLKEVRALTFMSGKCTVLVPMYEEGWRKIVARSGFEWYPIR